MKRKGKQHPTDTFYEHLDLILNKALKEMAPYLGGKNYALRPPGQKGPFPGATAKNLAQSAITHLETHLETELCEIMKGKTEDGLSFTRFGDRTGKLKQSLHKSYKAKKSPKCMDCHQPILDEESMVRKIGGKSGLSHLNACPLPKGRFLVTRLSKLVRRQTETTIRDGGKLRRLVVTLYPGDVIGVRPERTRREEVTTLASVYGLAVKQRVAKEQAEKRQNRKLRRRA